MVFGAFFTAYFFIRVVGGADWPAEGTELPKLIAGINTCGAGVVVADHALGAGEREVRQPLRAAGRHGHDVPARRDVPVRADQRVRAHRLLAAGPRAGDDLLRAHGPARRARVHRPDAARDGHHTGVPRPLLARPSTTASRCRASTGTSSTSCGSSSTRRSTSCDQPAAAPSARRSASCSTCSPSRRWSSCSSLRDPRGSSARTERHGVIVRPGSRILVATAEGLYLRALHILRGRGVARAAPARSSLWHPGSRCG